MTMVRTLFVALAVSLVTFLPLVSYAAPANFFGPIISEECKCETSAPDWGCVLQTIQNTINLGISIGVMFAVLVFAYAGFLFMTSSFNAYNREKARTVMLHAVIGLLIALSAWLIVDFVMKALYNEQSQFGPWNAILSGGNQCLVTTTPPTGTGNTTVTGSGTGVTGASSNSTAGRSNLTDTQVRNQLRDAGYSFWSSGRCTEDRSGCTHLGGLQQSALSGMIALAGRNGCRGMTITGGTEPGHSGGTHSHGNGYKIDVEDNQLANSCIQTHGTRYPAGDRGGDYGGTAYCLGGRVYVKESSHWDINFGLSCS